MLRGLIFLLLFLVSSWKAFAFRLSAECLKNLVDQKYIENATIEVNVIKAICEGSELPENYKNLRESLIALLQVRANIEEGFSYDCKTKQVRIPFGDGSNKWICSFLNYRLTMCGVRFQDGLRVIWLFKSDKGFDGDLGFFVLFPENVSSNVMEDYDLVVDCNYRDKILDCKVEDVRIPAKIRTKINEKLMISGGVPLEKEKFSFIIDRYLEEYLKKDCNFFEMIKSIYSDKYDNFIRFSIENAKEKF